MLLAQVAVLQVCAAQLPQVTVPPQPSEIVPQLFAGQVVSGVQQLPLKQVLGLAQLVPTPVCTVEVHWFPLHAVARQVCAAQSPAAQHCPLATQAPSQQIPDPPLDVVQVVRFAASSERH